MQGVEVMGRIGPDGPGIFVLYTGGTIGMGHGADGALEPLDLRELGAHLPFVKRLPLGLTIASFVEPIDSSAMRTSDWITIADAIIEHSPGHAGVVVLHGTDTMAYTASALSFLLDDIDIPIVLTSRVESGANSAQSPLHTAARHPACVSAGLERGRWSRRLRPGRTRQ